MTIFTHEAAFAPTAGGASALDMPTVQIGHGPTITVIGGGFSGTTAVLNLLTAHQEQRALDPLLSDLNIRWFDSTGRFGSGIVYEPQAPGDDRVFMLNQPAKLMSPFAEDPLRYAKWLEQTGAEYGADDFTPRALYGRFLNELLLEAKIASPGVKIEQRIGAIDQIAEEQGHLAVHLRDEVLSTESIIVAIGHREHDPFAAFRVTPGYLWKVREVEAYRKLIESNPEARSVTLIGGGPSAVDAIRALEHLSFKGEYRIVSSAPTEPWRFDPQLYSPESFESFGRRGLKFCSLATLQQGEDYRSLLRGLRREVLEAIRDGFGPGHVYYSIDLDGLEEAVKASTSAERREILVRFGEIVSGLRGNLTSPESHDLIQGLKEDGRLRWVKGRAKPERTEWSSENGYGVWIEGRTRQGIRETSDLLINCAQITRKNGTGNEVLQALSHDRVHLVGPPLIAQRAIPGHFGVERFRDDISAAALSALREAFEDKH